MSGERFVKEIAFDPIYVDQYVVVKVILEGGN